MYQQVSKDIYKVIQQEEFNNLYKGSIPQWSEEYYKVMLQDFGERGGGQYK